MNICWSAAVNLLIQSFPAHLMAYLPFQDRLRYPLWKALLPVFLVQSAELLLYGHIVQIGADGMTLEYAFAPVYMVMYFFSVLDNRCKILFLYLFISDYTMILWGAAAFLEAQFFYDPSANFTSWKSVFFSLIVLVITAPIMLHYLTREKEKVFATDAPRFWRTAWLIPAFMTILVYISTSDLSMKGVRSFRFLFSRVMLLLCAFAFYSILLDALDGIRRQAALAEQAAIQEQLLNLQQTQHKQIIQYMEDMREVRHDLRQHLSVIWAYLEQKDIDGLKHYLQAYEEKLPADIRRTFTQNFALNAVCTHFAEEARKHEIDYDVRLNMPDRLPISQPELCALLGNLLENAVDACRMVQSAPFIRVRGMCEDDQIVITVDNSCEQEPKWEGERLRSSKHDGFGTGTWVVQRTAERTGGMAKFSCEDGIFYSSVMLCGNEEIRSCIQKRTKK